MDKLDFNIIKNFINGIIKKLKRQEKDWKKNSQNISDKVLTSRIYKELSKLSNRSLSLVGLRLFSLLPTARVGRQNQLK